MSSLNLAVKRLYQVSGLRRAHLAVHRAMLCARAGAIRNDIGVLLHADPDDERGVLLARMGGALDRNAIAAWRRLADQTRPTVTIDVGANYGEVSFCTRYPGLREMHLVEPNPAVLPWLRRTVGGCAGRYPPIHLHAAAASDRTGTARLGLAGPHSGTVSLARPDPTGPTGPAGATGLADSASPTSPTGSAGSAGPEVATFRLDERIELRDRDTLLFKIDVEGHERAVLEGMSGLVKGRHLAGICEIQQADDELIDYLCGNFSVHLVRAGHEIGVDARGLRAAISTGAATGWRELSKDVVLRPLG